MLRKEYIESEKVRKEARQKAKETREYEIFNEMPYKFSGRKYN